MRARRALLTVLGAFGGLAAGIGLAVAYVLGTGSSDVATGTITPAGITVSNASVGGLYPGASKPFDVMIDNTGPYDLTLSSATLDATSNSCLGHVTIGIPAGTLPLESDTEATVELTATMLLSAPNSCQSLNLHTIPLTITASTT
jgi:hypothetical protein